MPTEIFVADCDENGRVITVDDTETMGDIKARIAKEFNMAIDDQVWKDRCFKNLFEAFYHLTMFAQFDTVCYLNALLPYAGSKFEGHREKG